MSRGGILAKSGLGLARILAVLGLLAVLAVFAAPTWLDVWLGLPLVVAGGLVRAWAAGYLFKTQKLAVSGPYAFTRNPLYLGRLLLFTGFGLMARLPGALNLVVLAIGYAVFFGYYMPRKERVECERLRQTHGAAYDRYFAAVPALRPRLSPYRPEGGGTVSGDWHWSRFARNREYMMLLLEAGLVTLFALRAAGVLPALGGG